jgi:hypothetical protein
MTSKRLLADHVLQAIKSGLLDDFAGPDLRRLDEILSATLSTLRTVPPTWCGNIRRSTDPSHYAPRGQPLRLFGGALEDIEANIGFLAYGNCYKLAALIEDTIDSLNRRRFTEAVSATRAITETSAVLHHWLPKLRPHFEAVSALTPRKLRLSARAFNKDTMGAVLKTLTDAMTALRAQPQLTKWNWLVFTGEDAVDKKREVPKGLEQVNVLTAIDKMKLSRSYNGRDLRVFYEALCDCVHPNRGSYMLFMDTCEVTNVFWRPVLRAHPTHQEAVLTSLAFIAVPLQELVPIAASCVAELLDWHGKVSGLRNRLRPYL